MSLSHSHFSDQPFPRLALLGAAALLGFALLVTIGAQLTDRGTTGLAAGQPVLSRELRFQQQADGSMVITAVADQQVVEVLAPGSGGFVRGVLRSLNRQRKLQGIGPEPAYQLTRWQDGGLSLGDSVTGQRIHLEPFGPANTAAFARLLSAETPARSARPAPGQGDRVD